MSLVKVYATIATYKLPVCSLVIFAHHVGDLSAINHGRYVSSDFQGTKPLMGSEEVKSAK